MVFTVPEQIATIAYQNKRELYGILFRATAQTLLTIGADPKHLGAKIGFFAVLHTWGSNLLHHPHLHCVVVWSPAAVSLRMAIDGFAGGMGFSCPCGCSQGCFRRLFLEYLLKAFDAEKLEFFSSLQSLRDPSSFSITWLPGARPNGWSTQSGPSPDPSTCWTMLGAILIAWRSPIIVC